MYICSHLFKDYTISFHSCEKDPSEYKLPLEKSLLKSPAPAPIPYTRPPMQADIAVVAKLRACVVR
jgi:hypothetical protein